ncbi:DUF1493 family protein [Paraburkholderia sp.]|uniref:DUF1493 family protein n=1 Tax=Paraburkholderia sp. TaxID=1926495 RepID=UPI0039E6527E
MTQPLELSDNLLSFINKQAGLWRQHILVASTTIERDLGVTGIDAGEFMEAFFQHFNVDPGDYDEARYFGPEGFELGLSFITRWIERRHKVKRPPKEILTIGMLQRAIEFGVWDSQRLSQ